MQKEPRSVIFFSLLLFVVGVGLSFAAWDGKTKTKPSKTETIDKQKYFLIENEANLAWFADSANKYALDSANGSQIRLNAKITARHLDMGGKPWTPIAAGNGGVTFAGVFDGNNAVISNLFISSDNLVAQENNYGQNVGFIAAVYGGTVKNVVLENVQVHAAGNIGQFGSGPKNPVSIGSVVAWLKSGTVENSYASGVITSSGKGQRVGGIVGNVDAGTIRNSLSAMTIRASGEEGVYVGGVVGGHMAGLGKITVSACAYDGGELFNGSSEGIGGVIGYLADTNFVFERNYFDVDAFPQEINPVGLGTESDTVSLNAYTKGVKNLNTVAVTCDLNAGEIKDGVCTLEGSWSMGSAHITLNGVSQNSNGDLVYMISFDANGGEFSDGAKTKKFLKMGEQITAEEIAAPVRGDTVFGGWALAPDAAEPVENLGTIDGPKTIYAYWKNMFEITFDANGGTFPGEGSPTVVTKKVAEGEAIDVSGIELPSTYTSGDETFYFAGWAKSSEATTQEDLGNATATSTFYAVWTKLTTYTVVFNTQRNFGTTAAYVQEGSKVSKPTNPVAEGYTFGEWYGDKDCSESQKFDFDTEITGNVTLYAKWTPETYKIAYELGDGAKNNKANPETYTVETETIVLKNPSRTGYTFEGWYYDKKFSMPAVQITKGSTGDKSLFAKWSVKTFPIVYMAGSYGVEVVPSDVKQYDVPINLRGASYTREGYLQDGWSTKNGGSKVYELDAVYKQNSTLTLYPYWVEDPTYKKDPSSIRDFASVRIHGFGIVVQNRGLEIVNVRPGAAVSVTDMQGRLVRKGVASSTGFRVTGLVPGNYVVRVNGVVRQVRIR